MTHTKIKWILSIVIIMWGSNFVLTKILVEQFPFWSLLFIRNLFATIALIWFIRNSPFILPRNKRAWVYILGASILGVVINNAIFLIGLKYSLPTNAALIMGLTPLVTSLMSYLVFSVPFNWKQILGISLGFFGVTLVVLKGSITNLIHLSFSIGDFYIVIALLTFSISFIFIKKAIDMNVSPEIISFYLFGISSICYFPLSFWELTMEGWSHLPTSIIPWLLLLYLGAFPLGVGNLLWNRGISVLGPSQSAIFMNGIPLVTAIASLLILDEPILVLQIIGFLFIGSGVFLGSQNSKPAAVTVINNEKKTSSTTL
ncbi:drug/metabolite transporter (DMT)-like permease [Neobacillus niacini]|uniref:DMT family transporter n=1 Tax=Neobacillus niacini TaxID=86668 RepID=UPI00285E2062|nr:DMT family transporter [Neobacillus niacini]MDR7075728.1 drug/metabolite transporter (DMT)-like permease [Neobacillus niacini]